MVEVEESNAPVAQSHVRPSFLKSAPLSRSLRHTALHLSATVDESLSKPILLISCALPRTCSMKPSYRFSYPSCCDAVRSANKR
jgi:hypothetical protein